MTDAYGFVLRTIDGKDRRLSDYRGKVMLIVNVASKCGLTPHYAGLEKMHRELESKGLVVCGVPCNQFGKQEPGTEAEIQTFCSTKYDVTFPMFAKVDVNGPERHPLYAWLCSESTTPDGPGDISWNFAKFIIGRDGKITARFAPDTDPTSPSFHGAVEAALGV